MGSTINSIVVVGDSLSRGVVFSEDKKRYVFSDDSFFNTVQKKLSATLTNAAKFGSTIDYGLKFVRDKLPKLSSGGKDVVLIEFGGNDCDFKWDEIALSPESEHLPNTSLESFENELREMVRDVREQKKLPVLMNLPPLDAPAYFRWFTGGDESKGAEILKWLGDISVIYWWHERYSSAINRVARATRTRLIDIRSEFLKFPDYRRFICVDGIHPNEQGHKLIAETILDYIPKNTGLVLG